MVHIFGETKRNSPNAKAEIVAKKAKFGPKLKKKGLNQPELHLEEYQQPPNDASKRLLVKRKTIRDLLDTGLSGDLLFLQKGSNRYIPIVNRAIPESWSTYNGTFETKKVGNIDLYFVEYSASNRMQPLYNLIIGKQTLHDLGAVLDFKEKTITIDEILLPMRNINSLQLKRIISRVLKQNTCLAQEPESTRNSNKSVGGILDTIHDKADLPSIVRDNCAHLSPSHHNSLLALRLRFEELFDGTIGD